MSGLDRLVAAAARAWAARGAVARAQAVRALATLGPELCAVALAARGEVRGAVVAVAVWLAVELTLGARADAQTSAILGAPPMTDPPWRVALSRTAIPLALLLAPALAALVTIFRVPLRFRAVLEVLGDGMLGTVVAVPIAVWLHVRVAGAYAVGSRAEARAWARRQPWRAAETAALTGAARLGLAWLSSALASTVGRDPLWLWCAIAAAAVPARAVALAAWVEATCAGAAPRR